MSDLKTRYETVSCAIWELIEQLENDPSATRHWVSDARIQLQRGLMAVKRAILSA